MGSYGRKNSHMDIETYDMLILLLKTCKMRYYTTLNSKIGILSILADRPFSEEVSEKTIGVGEITTTFFCVLGTLKDHKNKKIENKFQNLARIHLYMH